MRLPRKPQRPCRYPGCGRLSDEPYCEEHRKAVRVEYNRYSGLLTAIRSMAGLGNESATAMLRRILCVSCA